MGNTQRWVQLGYDDAINMGPDRYAHMVYNTLKTRASHKVQHVDKGEGLKMVIMPGWIRLSQAALARELGIGRQTLLHTLRYLEMKGIIGYKPDERGTTIWFKNFAYHRANDASSKQGCLEPRHYNKSLKDRSITPKTLGIKKAAPGGSFTAAGAWTPGVEETRAYLSQGAVEVASKIPDYLKPKIRELQGMRV